MRLPTVTCLVTAYNCSRYIVEAIDSALGQDYPQELLDVLVVNDGSTDDTAATLERHYGDNPRVRLIHQRNAGVSAATNTGLAAVTGELFAPLDGDDVWRPDKTRRQVSLLMHRPEVGLVHGDLEMIDGTGRITHHSAFTFNCFPDPPRGYVLTELMRGPNFIASSAMIVRSSIISRICPLPTQYPAQDWSIVVRVAERAAVDRVDGTIGSYRVHASNRGNGIVGRKFFEKVGDRARQQRWMFGAVAIDDAPLGGLCEAVTAMLVNVQRSALETDSLPGSILVVNDEERAAAQARTRAAATLYAEHPDRAARGWIRALALDPFNGEAQACLTVARARLERERAAAPPPPIPVRGVAVAAFAEELVATPEMLRAYAEAVDSRANVTLLIQAHDGTTSPIATALIETVASVGLDRTDGADLVLHACLDPAELLTAPVRALYSRRAVPAALTGVPRIDDGTLDELPVLLTS